MTKKIGFFRKTEKAHYSAEAYPLLFSILSLPKYLNRLNRLISESLTGDSDGEVRSNYQRPLHETLIVKGKEGKLKTDYVAAVYPSLFSILSLAKYLRVIGIRVHRMRR